MNVFTHIVISKWLHRNLINHFLYEMKLHNVLPSNASQIIIKPILKKIHKNIASIMMELIEEYSFKPSAMKKDIIYGFTALSASVRFFKSAFSHTINATTLVLENKINYATLTFQGGH